MRINKILTNSFAASLLINIGAVSFLGYSRLFSPRVAASAPTESIEPIRFGVIHLPAPTPTPAPPRDAAHSPTTLSEAMARGLAVGKGDDKNKSRGRSSDARRAGNDSAMGRDTLAASVTITAKALSAPQGAANSAGKSSGANGGEIIGKGQGSAQGNGASATETRVAQSVSATAATGAMRQSGAILGKGGDAAKSLPGGVTLSPAAKNSGARVAASGKGEKTGGHGGLEANDKESGADTDAPAEKTPEGKAVAGAFIMPKVAKMWNVPPGQKIVLPNGLKLVMPKELPVLTSVAPLSAEQLAQLRKMLEGQNLQQMKGVTKEQLKKMLAARQQSERIAPPASALASAPPPAEKKPSPVKRGEKKPRPVTNGAAKERLASLPPGLQSPFRYRPWNLAWHQRYAPVVKQVTADNKAAETIMGHALPSDEPRTKTVASSANAAAQAKNVAGTGGQPGTVPDKTPAKVADSGATPNNATAQAGDAAKPGTALGATGATSSAANNAGNGKEAGGNPGDAGKSAANSGAGGVPGGSGDSANGGDSGGAVGQKDGKATAGGSGANANAVTKGGDSKGGAGGVLGSGGAGNSSSKGVNNGDAGGKGSSGAQGADGGKSEGKGSPGASSGGVLGGGSGAGGSNATSAKGGNSAGNSGGGGSGGVLGGGSGGAGGDGSSKGSGGGAGNSAGGSGGSGGGAGGGGSVGDNGAGGNNGESGGNSGAMEGFDGGGLLDNSEGIAGEASDASGDANGMDTGFVPAHGVSPNFPEHNHDAQKGLPGALVLPPLPPVGTETGKAQKPRIVKKARQAEQAAPRGETLVTLPTKPSPARTASPFAPKPVPASAAERPLSAVVGSASRRGTISLLALPVTPPERIAPERDAENAPLAIRPDGKALKPKSAAPEKPSRLTAPQTAQTGSALQIASMRGAARQRQETREQKYRNSKGVKEGSLTPIPPTPLPDSDAELGDGSGLRGEYYLGRNFEQYQFSKADANLDLFWGGDRSPSPRLPVGADWSCRWTGKIAPRYSETYTFYAVADDGVRVWINHKLIIDDWTLHPLLEYSGTVKLEAGKQYDIRVDYFESGGPPASVGFYWESARQKKEFVPEECLFYPLAGSKVELEKDEKPH